MRGSILDTVGIEFESVGLTRGEVANIISSSNLERYFNIDRDASVEFNAARLAGTGVIVNSHTPAARELPTDGGRITSGYEVTTVPLTIREVEPVIWKFISECQRAGDFIHPRAALHIHVGFAYSLKILKRLIGFGIKLDPLLFRLAGMETKYRGELNNNTYARPLVLGPVVKGRNREYYRILDVNSVLNSSSIANFWGHYAIDPEQGVGRYHPGRYFAINLYSLLLHRTIEFRHFNQSLNPLLILSTIKFVRGLAELIFFSDEDFIENMELLDIFKEYPTHVYEELLINLIQKMRDLDLNDVPNNKETSALISNLYSTPHHVIKRDNVLTHVNDYTLGANWIETGYFQKVSGRVVQAGQVDIHTIRDFSIMS